MVYNGGMGIDELRERLERLNRGPLGDAVRPASELLQGREQDAPRQRGAEAEAGGGGRRDWRLETLCPGREVRTDHGVCYVVERRLSEAGDAGARIVRQFRSAYAADVATGRSAPGRGATGRSATGRGAGAAGGASGGAGEAVHEELMAAVSAGEERLLFVDLETCGFAGTPVFLIGVMYVSDGELCVKQLLARSYAEEPAILGRFGALLSDRPHLVTFNGKSFDWPFLVDRAAVSRVTLCDTTGHCDLLHIARRRYKDSLPDCRLQTLEQYLCGRRRSNDIPGSQIPAAYHAFVRSGDAREVGAILYHNFLDLVTLAEIHAVLLGK